MMLNQIRCEDEPIHLVGRIQQFGKLVIVDKDLSIAGISANCAEWLDNDVASYLGRTFPEFLSACSAEAHSDILHLVDIVASSKSEREVIETSFVSQPVYVRIYDMDPYVYIEFEDKKTEQANLLNLTTYTKRLNNSGEELWQVLCDNIREVIGYDRVMVYHFLEDGSGQVLAEAKKADITSYLGFRFPDFDIPVQARELYLKHHVRQTSDILQETYPVLSAGDKVFDLTYSHLRALSPIHLQYLENAGARSSVSFSIVVQDQLWGLVACQHSEPRHIDYYGRTIGLFLTEFAVNKYINFLKQEDANFDRQLSLFEVKLKENAVIQNDVISGLSAALPELAKLMNADGVAVVHPDRNLVWGVKLDNRQLNTLHTYINQHTDKVLFKDHNFAIAHGADIPFMLRFAGLCRIDVDGTRDFSLYAFRREQVFEEEWAGNPEKIVHYDPEDDCYKPSPRRSFESWKREVRGTAPRWTDRDILCLQRFQRIVVESQLLKSQEIQRLNQELIQLNNALDTYSSTLTHDLKNPLSSIKLMGQFLLSQSGKESADNGKIARHILGAVKNMEELIAKTNEYSRAKVYEFVPEWIDMAPTIYPIIDACATQHNVDRNCVSVDNELLPVFGEKTLLNQIFSNIIGNAIKYSSKTDRPDIRISSFIEEDSIHYVVKDNGIGIDPAELEGVFDVFRRLSNAKDYEGTGVGLSIVKRIVERLGAEIRVESELGKGTTVYLEFPNARIPAYLQPPVHNM